MIFFSFLIFVFARILKLVAGNFRQCVWGRSWGGVFPVKLVTVGDFNKSHQELLDVHFIRVDYCLPQNKRKIPSFGILGPSRP